MWGLIQIWALRIRNSKMETQNVECAKDVQHNQHLELTENMEIAECGTHSQFGTHSKWGTHNGELRK